MDLDGSADIEPAVPKRETSGRRAASKKVDYAALLNDDEDEDSDNDAVVHNPKFDSDDEDDLLDNTGIDQRPAVQQQMNNTDDMFDSLKSEEDTPLKKPPVTKRKLGAKPEEIKPPSKRAKKMTSDSDDSPVKVFINSHNKCFGQTL